MPSPDRSFPISAARPPGIRRTALLLWGNSLSQSLTALPAPSGREPLAKPEALRLNWRLCHYAKGPISEGAVAEGDWGSLLPWAYPFRLAASRQATFPKGTAEPSQSSRFARCQLPRRGSFLHLPVSTNKAPPSGELANAVSLRGFVLRKRPRPLSLASLGSSPKGRASGETGGFAIHSVTFPLCQGLSLWERWHGVAVTERARLLPAPPLPQEAGAANDACRHDPTRENEIAERPQSLSGQSPSIC